MTRISPPTLTRRGLLAAGAAAAFAPRVARADQGSDMRGLEAGVDKLVREAGIRDGEPGVAVLLMKPGRVLLAKGYGLADLRNRTPITRFTRFELASVSKIFTASAVLHLQERGLLALDDDVRKYLPELPAYQKEPLRLADMLHHVSGLPSYLDLRNVPMRNKTYWVSADYPPAFAHQQRQVGPRFPIGERYDYNNSNFMLLSLVVERAARKPFPSYMHDEIFVRVGMPNTFVYGSPDGVTGNSTCPCNNALGYELKNAWVESWGTAPARHEQHLETGDGAVWTNLTDLASWDTVLRLNKLLEPKTMKLALTPSTTRDRKTNPYGLGWMLFMQGATVAGFGHNGRWGGFETYYRNTPGNTVALLSNRGPTLDLEAMWPKLDALIQTYGKA